MLIGSKDDGFEYIYSSDIPKNNWKESRNTFKLSDDTEAGVLALESKA